MPVASAELFWSRIPLKWKRMFLLVADTTLVGDIAYKLIALPRISPFPMPARLPVSSLAFLELDSAFARQKAPLGN